MDGTHIFFARIDELDLGLVHRCSDDVWREHIPGNINLGDICTGTEDLADDISDIMFSWNIFLRTTITKFELERMR